MGPPRREATEARVVTAATGAMPVKDLRTWPTAAVAAVEVEVPAWLSLPAAR